MAGHGLTNVEFLPYRPKEELRDSLGAADLHVVGLKRGLAGYIVPSKVYGILAAGKPYVAAVEPGTEPALIVEESGCGVRVEPGDPGLLADAIRELRGGPLEEMGTNARRASRSASIAQSRPGPTGSYWSASRSPAEPQAHSAAPVARQRDTPQTGMRHTAGTARRLPEKSFEP